jgi:hypothetical protein
MTEIPKHGFLVTYARISNGPKGSFPGGVFSSIEIAEEWIKRHKLNGTLTLYPLDQGCLDWAVEHELTNMKAETFNRKKDDPNFIGSFSTASQEHHHYENGCRCC